MMSSPRQSPQILVQHAQALSQIAREIDEQLARDLRAIAQDCLKSCQVELAARHILVADDGDRAPAAAKPISFSSSVVSSDSTSQLIAFASRAGAYFSRPRSRNPLAMSTASPSRRQLIRPAPAGAAARG